MEHDGNKEVRTDTLYISCCSMSEPCVSRWKECLILFLTVLKNIFNCFQDEDEDDRKKKEKEKDKDRKKDRDRDREREKEKDKKKEKEKIKYYTADPGLLLSYVYFDQTHCGYILATDVEEIIHTLGLILSRSQVRSNHPSHGEYKMYVV